GRRKRMKQGSRARYKQRYRGFTTESLGAASPGSSGDAGAAMAMAAESSDDPPPDLPVSAFIPTDPQDPPEDPAPEMKRSTRAHIEDDFFARGDEISFPPSSVDARHIEAEEVVRRPIHPSILARRARMRRIVGSGIATAAVLTLLVVGRAWVVGHA